MVGVILPFILGVLLYALMVLTGARHRQLIALVLGGYLLRLLLNVFVMREVQFFSHGVGGDCIQYEYYAKVIVAIWHRSGIHFINDNELPQLGPTSLPPNLFALVIYLNDGPTNVGCVSLVAFAAGLTALNIYTLSIEVGSTSSDAFLITALLYLGPTFLFYTSDMYKDGLVVCLTIGVLGSAVRLTRRFSLPQIAVGLTCLAGLWYVRFYLVFVVATPLLAGLVGLGSRSIVRPLVGTLIILIVLLVLGTSTGVLQSASERASSAFELGTTTMADANATSGGSSVEITGASAVGAFASKLAFTLFSPFLWASGSIGMQIGKLDSILWYFVLFRAARGLRKLDRRVLLAVLSFVLPCIAMYAMIMTNVGLIVRERLVFVFATAIVASAGASSVANVQHQHPSARVAVMNR